MSSRAERGQGRARRERGARPRSSARARRQGERTLAREQTEKERLKRARRFQRPDSEFFLIFDFISRGWLGFGGGRARSTRTAPIPARFDGADSSRAGQETQEEDERKRDRDVTQKGGVRGALGRVYCGQRDGGRLRVVGSRGWL
jgi:hypothetical protein